MTRSRRIRYLVASVVVIVLATGSGWRLAAASPDAATPATSLCSIVQTGAATPPSDQGVLTGTPDNGMTMAEQIEFDLLFIDMMIPHHESAVVMAQVALERAEHEEIRQLAEAIIAAQTSEIAQLQAWRDEWYPGADELPMDQMNMVMTGLMHGMMDMGGTDSSGSMAEMDSSSALISLCLAGDPFDLAFLDAMIPHHQSAIMMANIGLEHSTHPEMKTLELAIIDGQQSEIDQMLDWRAAWYGPATPTS